MGIAVEAPYIGLVRNRSFYVPIGIITQEGFGLIFDQIIQSEWLRKTGCNHTLQINTDSEAKTVHFFNNQRVYFTVFTVLLMNPVSFRKSF